MGSFQQADCYNFFNNKPCPKGDDCKFRHESSALTTTQICKFWSNGSCRVENCKFRHRKYKVNQIRPYSLKSHRSKPFSNGYQMKPIIDPDSVYDVKTEPIAVELHMNGDSLTHRQIRQAPVPRDRLSTKIALPKQPSELCYKADTEDLFHVKTYDEIKKERDIKHKIHLAKRKQLRLEAQVANSNEQTLMEETPIKPGSRNITILQHPQRTLNHEPPCTSMLMLTQLSNHQSASNGILLPPSINPNITNVVANGSLHGNELISPVHPHHFTHYLQAPSGTVKSEPTAVRAARMSIFHRQFKSETDSGRKVELYILDSDESDTECSFSQANILEPSAFNLDLPPRLVPRDSIEYVDIYKDDDCDMDPPPPLLLPSDEDSDQMLFDELDELNNSNH